MLEFRDESLSRVQRGKNNPHFEFLKQLTRVIEQAGSSMEQVLALSELKDSPSIGSSERVKQESDAVVMLQARLN